MYTYTKCLLRTILPHNGRRRRYEPFFSLTSRETLPLWSCFHAFILSTRNVIQRSLKMLPRILQRLLVVCRVKIAMYEFDKSVEVLRRHRVILLIEVVDVAIQNFDEELHGYSGIHTSISNAQGTLEAFKNAFAIAVELQ